MGHSRSIMLPHNRGFDTHYGFWSGMQDYYDHTVYKDGVRDLDYKFLAVIFQIEMLIVWFHEKKPISILCLKKKFLLHYFLYIFMMRHSAQWARKMKKLQAKKTREMK